MYLNIYFYPTLPPEFCTSKNIISFVRNRRIYQMPITFRGYIIFLILPAADTGCRRNSREKRYEGTEVYQPLCKAAWTPVYTGNCCPVCRGSYECLYSAVTTGEITDGLEAQTLDMDGVLGLILRILILGAIVALGRFFWRYFIFGASRSIEKEMRNDLFAHWRRCPCAITMEHKTGDLMAHFTNDLQSIRMFLGPTVITAFDATVSWYWCSDR